MLNYICNWNNKNKNTTLFSSSYDYYYYFTDNGSIECYSMPFTYI